MNGWIRTSAGNYNLGVSSIEKFRIPLPPVEEQQEIVNRLDDIDDGIYINQRYRSRLKSLKQGLMQDLITGDVRVTDSNIDVPEEVA